MGTAAENKAKSKRRLQEALNKTKNKNYNSFSGTVDKLDVNKENAAEIRKGNRTATVSDAINVAGFAAGPAIGGGKMLFGLGAKALSKFLPKGLLAKITGGTKLSAKEIAQANKLKKLDAAKNNTKPSGLNMPNKTTTTGTKTTSGRARRTTSRPRRGDKTTSTTTTTTGTKPSGLNMPNKTTTTGTKPSGLNMPKKTTTVSKKTTTSPKSSEVVKKTKTSLGSKIAKGAGIAGIAAVGTGLATAIGNSNTKKKKKVPTKTPSTGNPGTGNEITKSKNSKAGGGGMDIGKTKKKAKYTGRYATKDGGVGYDNPLDFIRHMTGNAKEKEVPKNRKEIKNVAKKGATKGVKYKSMGGKIKMAKGYSAGGKIFTGR